MRQKRHTVRLSREAYNILLSRQRKGETYSDTLLRMIEEYAKAHPDLVRGS